MVNERGELFDGTTRTRIGSGDKLKDVFMVTTPRVVAAAREFFDCPTLQGVELEEYNEDGKVGSHWDERILVK